MYASLDIAVPSDSTSAVMRVERSFIVEVMVLSSFCSVITVPGRAPGARRRLLYWLMVEILPVALAWSRIEARGAQALDFLQGQLTQDLADLPTEGRWSLLLRPDSVVVAALLVTPADGGLDLTLERAAAQEAMARLRRFLLRVACRLELVEVASGPYATTEDLVAAGWPGAREFALELTPHAFGSRVVESTVSFTKGCYTGQELVGRLDARGGNVPWRLVRAAGPDVARLDAALRSKGPTGPAGVTTWAAGPDGVRALGVAHRSLLDAPLPDGVTSLTAL